ncbi:MAG: 3-phenylpropionate/cinnamic acid dioxygenase subunit beta [Alphaproteobacteria bacterium]|jgi:3-phenylpropionate/cinnamic acid dioxygenase small subunit
MAIDAQAELQRLLLKEDIGEFLAFEADLLDARRYEDWLALLTEDIRYWMPMARNMASDDTGREFTIEDEDVNWIEEGIETIRQRVAQLATGLHWAEQPPSRTSHMISNLRVLENSDGLDEVKTRCRFLVYRNRLEDEQNIFVGKRNDTLRRANGSWKIARREIYLDQNVMLSKNLSVFF